MVMPQKSVRLTIILLTNIALITLSLLLLFYPTSTVSAINTSSNQSFAIDEQYVQNKAPTSMAILQSAIFLPILKILTVIGMVTMSYVLLSKLFSNTRY